MEQISKELIIRTKKSLFIIIIVPLILAAVGYFVQINTTPRVNYEANAKIELGFYDDYKMNEANKVASLLNNYDFLMGLFPDSESEEIKILKKDLEVMVEGETRLQIKLKGDSDLEARESLQELVAAFMSFDKELFDKKYTVLKENVSQLAQEEVNETSKVEKQRFLYEIQNDLLTIYPAQLAEPVSVNEYKTEEFSTKKRTVLGGLIGITVVFSYIVIPVLFRKEND